ncbi:MAG: hypothetical protein LIV11_06080 [Bacillota bacterium]|nr:hypothetical protein [Bacillota bacterium]
MFTLKIRKLLITTGVYSNEISDQVQKLFSEGRTVEIQQITGLSRSSVNGYLPYTKVVYKPEKLSANAERINVFRNRQWAIKALLSEMNEDRLWNAIVVFQRYPFHTAFGLLFTYELKKGKNGEYTRELIFDRRSESKSIVWSSVLLAFEKAAEMWGVCVRRPEDLGDIRGVSYIYPMLYRFGIIEVPEKTAEKMVGKRTKEMKIIRRLILRIRCNIAEGES